MRTSLVILATLSATPSFAASTMPVKSLFEGWYMSDGYVNTDFVVFVAFLLFVGILLWKKIPAMIGRMLDDRAVQIQNQLDEARRLREEAQTLLASFERKQREAEELAGQIVADAKAQAERDAEEAKEALKGTIARRMAAAEDRIQSAQNAAVAQVRNSAIDVALKAVSNVAAGSIKAADANKLIDNAIADLDGKLH